MRSLINIGLVRLLIIPIQSLKWINLVGPLINTNTEFDASESNETINKINAEFIIGELNRTINNTNVEFNANRLGKTIHTKNIQFNLDGLDKVNKIAK